MSIPNRKSFSACFIILTCLTLLCSCATNPDDSLSIAAPELPADLPMNKEAGHDNLLFVAVRLENGPDFFCAIDTGSPSTLLPRQLESKLGKRLGAYQFSTPNSTNQTENLYDAPQLYLGNTPLITSSRIGTWGESFGLLGMDCLCHYCLQLDFENGKLRFLDSEHLDSSDLGKAYPLTFNHHVYIPRDGPLGDGWWKTIIDTGCRLDGLEPAGFYRRVFKKQKAAVVPMLKEGQLKTSPTDFASFPKSTWDGETYTNLIIEKGGNCIGLKFLARHLVTLNFPKRVMYLKRIREPEADPKAN